MNNKGLLCKVGSDFQAIILCSKNNIQFSASLSECLEFARLNKFKLNLLFDYDAAYLKAVKVDGDIKSRKNWNIYQVKDLFADEEFLNVQSFKDITTFISFGNIKSLIEQYKQLIQTIDWQGNRLNQQIQKALWFGDGVKIVVDVYEQSYVIQGFYNKILIINRVVNKQHIALELDIEETIRYIARFVEKIDKCEVVLLNSEIALESNDVYEVRNFTLLRCTTLPLFQKKFNWYSLVGVMYGLCLISLYFTIRIDAKLDHSLLIADQQEQELKNQLSSYKGYEHLETAKKLASMCEANKVDNELLIRFLTANAPLITQLTSAFDKNASKTELHIGFKVCKPESYMQFLKIEQFLKSRCYAVFNQKQINSLSSNQEQNWQKYVFTVV